MPVENYRCPLFSICYQEVVGLFGNDAVSSVKHWSLLRRGDKAEVKSMALSPCEASISGIVVPLYVDPLNKYCSA